MAEVIPAILEKDFAEIERKIHLVERYVDWVQIDMADGTLVPNTTFLDPSPFKKLKTSVNLELHLMVKDPLAYIETFAAAGFKRFFAHVEAEGVEDFLAKGEEMNVEVGLAADGPTPIERIHPFIADLDAVLIMAIKSGFSGQPFLPETVDRIKKVREWDFEIPITVDGAMDEVNAAKVVAAGATRINSNSNIFGSPNIKNAIDKLKSLQFSR